MEIDDRSKGEGWQTQRKRDWMAGQVRMEQLLAKADTIDVHEELVLPFTLGDECVDNIDMSKVSDKHSVSVARESTSKTPEGRSATCRVQGSGCFFPLFSF